MLSLTPHEIHDLEVASRLGDLLPPDPPASSSEAVRFDDIPGWRRR